MNVRDIKTKARSVIALNRSNIISIFVFISVITTVINYLTELIGSQIPFASLILGIIFLPLVHGNVVTALKTVNERSDKLTINDDGLAGLKRYKQLFSTYFIREILFTILIMLVFLIIALVSKFVISDRAFDAIIAILTSNASTNISSYLTDVEIATLYDQIGGIILFGLIALMIVIIMFSLYFALTPYVLEKYNIRGAKAMSESVRLMKGHKGTLAVLYLSYIGWFFLVVLLYTVVAMIIRITAINQLILAIISTYLYSAELEVCLAVFYEEIDLEDKNLI